MGQHKGKAKGGASTTTNRAETVADRLAQRVVLFDDGWRFHRGDVSGADRLGFDDGTWAPVDLPHDWSLDDLPAAELAPPTDVLAITHGVWGFRKGDDNAWKSPDIDDSDWERVLLPAMWELHSDYTQDHVYGWYRRRFDVPQHLRGKDVTLQLGKIDDVDETFINGVKVGGMGSFPPNFVTAFNDWRTYTIPASLLRWDGTDLIAVRVFDALGEGGILEGPSIGHRVGPFDTALSPGGRDTGYVVGGTGWYRKTFTSEAVSAGTRTCVRFDGIYMDADVWLNGVHLGNHPYGYTGFEVDLTPHLAPVGSPNLLAVRVRNEGRNSRWYSGSGIYRHAWLTRRPAVHVPLWGVCVTTPEVQAEQAIVRVRVGIENTGAAAAETTVHIVVGEAYGKTVGKASAPPCVVDVGARVEIVADVIVPDPKLWCPEDPSLYVVNVELSVAGSVVDHVAERIGIRTFSFDARSGFLLNGQSLKLKGACIHHDNGPLGAMAIDAAEIRRVLRLRENGYNAIRTSHNPPSPAFLDTCDKLGMLVMDESFDTWRIAKNPQDYHRFFDAWWKADLESMVLRDRNHPSVILWSIGNEIPERADADGIRTTRMLVDAVRELDPTRPVTLAYNGVTDEADPAFALLDVCGYNYGLDRYTSDHHRHPMRVIVATESFPSQAFDYWMGVLDNPHVVGDFVWTGLDYLGESGIGFVSLAGGPEPKSCARHWPYHGSWCGDLDVTCFKKAQSYYRDVLWEESLLEMVVCPPLPEGARAVHCAWGWPEGYPHWTWPGSEGRLLKVHVYARFGEVRLSLNGRVVGTRPVSRTTRFTAEFELPYEPGTLEATLLWNGKPLAEIAFQTAGVPKKLQLAAECTQLAPNRNDLAFITIEATDESDLPTPQAVDLVRLTVEGPAKLAGVGNADPTYAGSFRRPECRPYQGRCLAILRPLGKPGSLTLRAEAPGLRDGTLKLPIR